MKDNEFSKTWCAFQFALSFILLLLGIVWLIGQCAQGTINKLGALLALTFIGGGVVLTTMTWKELRSAYK